MPVLASVQQEIAGATKDFTTPFTASRHEIRANAPDCFADQLRKTPCMHGVRI